MIELYARGQPVSNPANRNHHHFYAKGLFNESFEEACHRSFPPCLHHNSLLCKRHCEYPGKQQRSELAIRPFGFHVPLFGSTGKRDGLFTRQQHIHGHLQRACNHDHGFSISRWTCLARESLGSLRSFVCDRRRFHSRNVFRNSILREQCKQPSDAGRLDGDP